MKHLINFEEFNVNESAIADNKEAARKLEGEINSTWSDARNFLKELTDDQKEEVGKELEKILDFLDKASDEIGKVRKKIYSQDGLLWRK